MTDKYFGTPRIAFKIEDVFRNCSSNDGAPETHAFNPLPEGGFVSREMEPIICSEDDETPLGVIIPLEPKSKIRQCYRCGDYIGWSGFVRVNLLIPIIQLKKIWESEHIQLYCCICHRKIEKKEASDKKNERLLNKAKRISEKFGYIKVPKL